MPVSLLSLLVTFAVFAGLWRVSLRKQDCGVVDLYWSWGFSVIAAIALAALPSPTGPQWLFAAMIALWSVRLGLYLLLRHMRADGEDARYRAMRERHGPGWERQSFWMVFMLQALVLWIVASPIHAALRTDPLTPPIWLTTLALMLYAGGLLLETIADAALLRFRRDPGNRGQLLTSGVFAWSRHPNYFGESIAWWGIGLYALGLSGSWLALLGPAILTVLLTKVSGIPMLEAQLRQRPGFDGYAASTSAFFPWPRRSQAGIVRQPGK